MVVRTRESRVCTRDKRCVGAGGAPRTVIGGSGPSRAQFAHSRRVRKTAPIRSHRAGTFPVTYVAQTHRRRSCLKRFGTEGTVIPIGAPQPLPQVASKRAVTEETTECVEAVSDIPESGNLGLDLHSRERNSLRQTG